MKFSKVFSIIGVVLCVCSSGIASVPQLLNYQGRLASGGGTPLDTTLSITFTIYDAASGRSVKWTEAQSSVVVAGGIFNVLLGSVNPISDTVFSGDERWLGVKVGSDPETIPRSRLVSVGYSHRVGTVDGAAGGNISGSLSVNDNLSVGSWEDHYIEIADRRKRIRATADPDGALIFYTHSAQANPRWEFRNLLDESLLASIDGVTGSGYFAGGVTAEGDLTLGGNLSVGSWEDHYIEIADRRKRIRATADPDGALIFYTHSAQANPRWEFRNLNDESVKASIDGIDGNAWFDGTTSTDVLEIRGGSDLAEPFPVSNDEELPAGGVVVIDENNPGHLKLSTEPYDKRVAGVVSGAGGIKPGLTLKQEGFMEGNQNIALAGRVYVLAITENGAIKSGDLLTTSSTPGHAMKATDSSKSNGAIIGKAMTELEQGQGIVLVLVNLQ